MHEEVTLLERRKQLLTEEGDADSTGDQTGDRGEVAPAWPAKQSLEQAVVPSLQPTDQRRLPLLDRRLVEQDQAERRRDRERHAHRGEQREAVREDQRLEERPGQPLKEEDR